jgi:phenol 2-monooxygenase
MVIPREQDMVRLYIQIPQPEKGTRPNRADVTPERLLKAAQAIMAPYTLEIPKIEWVSFPVPGPGALSPLTPALQI